MLVPISNNHPNIGLTIGRYIKIQFIFYNCWGLFFFSPFFRMHFEEFQYFDPFQTKENKYQVCLIWKHKIKVTCALEYLFIYFLFFEWTMWTWFESNIFFFLVKFFKKLAFKQKYVINFLPFGKHLTNFLRKTFICHLLTHF